MICISAYSQNVDSSIQKIKDLPDKYYSKINSKLTSLDDQLSKKTEKYLLKLQRQEQKLQAKLEKLNPESATKLFSNSKEKYDQFALNIKSKTEKLAKLTGGQYNSYLDTLSTSLSFLKQFKDLGDKVNAPLASLEQLQNKFEQSEKIKQFISQRKLQIKSLLSKYTKIPSSLQKQFGKLNKTAYYYTQQVREIKSMLKDPAKIEKQALAILREIPAFKNFMQKNGQLAALFGFGSTQNGPVNIAGLQTRASVAGLIQQRIAMGGPNAMAQVSQNLSQAHQEMNSLKAKILKLGGNTNDFDLPNFTPNQQKTKKFLKRFVFGTDFQFGRSSLSYPASTDLGFSLGYKLNNVSLIGIGTNAKIGMGSFNHIKITAEAFGLRSFLDYKIKKHFYASGGWEANYYQRIKSLDQVRDKSGWKQSALLGMSKKYQINKKVKGNMKILYDFLARTKLPSTSPIIFRLGYDLK